ncbi:TonB-dependent receptor [Sphingomicrobium nitratireducens]|uniref:TonB-dependent receptor n=1 Tax=Sphingomicrobium nitratireducens TaxID=2964666 RepID=UPI00223FC154|nr:TonB-dependent receptor [Sphingomicrobium nitratireducens]
MIVSLLASASLLAIQDVPPSEEKDPPVEDVIVITGHVIEGLDLLAGASVLDGAALQRNMELQVGDTLASLPGVSATSFTPGASRPVLRGFQGERIRVLNDGLGAIDVSNTSADHAVTIDPLTAERIEVIRGPAVLIFGSQAVGGAVNVIDRRIPRRVPEGGFHGDLVGQLSSADDGVSLGAAADVSLGAGFVAHGDISWRKTEDVRVGDYVMTPALRADLLALAAEADEEGEPDEAAEAREAAGLRGVLPNSATEQTSGAVGLAWIGDRVELGASYGLYDSFYGVPMRPGAGHHHGDGEDEAGAEGEAPVRIDMHQERLDARARVEFEGFFESLTARFGMADYEHVELEGEEVGTRFLSDGMEGRVELKQRDADGWHGATGAQFYTRDFDAIGAEAFVPANTTDQWGIFTVQEYAPGRLGIEGGARIEWTDVTADTVSIARDFTTISAALGLNYEVTDDFKVGVNGSRAERAPSAEELLSDGPHVATQSYELGDPDLVVEKSWGGEAFARYAGRRVAASATLWANWFADFIYQADTGLEEDELPLFAYRQQDATYWGIEMEASATLAEGLDWAVKGDLVADYVRATLADGNPVPRIPPFRLGLGLTGEVGNFDGRIEVEWVADQNRTAAFETATDGHTMVNASLGWRPFGRDEETVIFVSANNVFDVDARRHASFTKDFVPLAGRDFRLGTRFSF